MSRFQSLRRAQHAQRALLAGVLAGMLALAGAAMYLNPAAAAPPIGPTPATSHAVTLSASPVIGLANGTAITFSVHTSGGTTLVGNITAHLCQHGFTSYGTTNFGYSGSPASRCIYQPGIVSGGITGADYDKVYGPFSGGETTSGSLKFHTGTGSVTWGNVSGYGPFSTQADTTHEIDLVIQVNLAGDATPVTYFIQPLVYTNVPGTPRSVDAKPGSTTTSTGPIIVSYAAPATNGGSAITKYTATCTSTNGGVTKSAVHTGSTVAAITVTGLTTAKAYTCKVKATNANGTGPSSTASVAIIVGSPARVATPSIAKAATGKLKVTFTNLTSAQAHGSALSTPKYTAGCTSSNGGVTRSATGTANPIYVGSLSAGKTYTCKVKAHNARGYGRVSPPSAAHTA